MKTRDVKETGVQSRTVSWLDAVSVGVLVVRHGVVISANLRMLDILGRAEGDVVGRSYEHLLAPEDLARVVARHQRRMRGESVPAEYELAVVTGCGEHRRIGVAIQAYGEDAVVTARDVTEHERYRERRLSLARVGASVQRFHTEANIFEALRAELRALGVSGVLVRPEEGGLRVLFYDPIPDSFCEELERRLGRPVEGALGAWTPLCRRAWERGQGYSDDALRDAGAFFAAELLRGLRVTTEPTRIPRAVAARVDRESFPSEILVLRGEWLSEDDLPATQLLGVQLSTALANARYITGARRRVQDVEVVNALARRVLSAAPESPARVLEASRDLVLEAFGAWGASVLLLDEGGGALREAVARGVTLSPSVAQEGGGVMEAMRASQPRVIAGASAGLRSGEEAGRDAAPCSALVIPLTCRKGPRGAVVVTDHPGRRYTDESVALGRAFGSVMEVGLEMAELYAEARQRLDELAATQAKLVHRERLAAIGELAAVMAHEVRNPLGVIFNSVSALGRMVPLEGDVRMLLDILREEAERLNRIVGDLLDYARPIRPDLHPTRVIDVIDDALDAAAAGDPSGEPRPEPVVERDVPDSLPEVSMDARLMRQAILNLVLNAIQAMPSGGTLAVSAREVTGPRGRMLRIEVSDTGVGIAERDLPRVFEPFFTTRSTGSGLGLPVVKRIVDSHDGEVSVRSRVGEGTTFTILLPVTG